MLSQFQRFLDKRRMESRCGCKSNGGGSGEDFLVDASEIG